MAVLALTNHPLPSIQSFPTPSGVMSQKSLPTTTTPKFGLDYSYYTNIIAITNQNVAFKEEKYP